MRRCINLFLELAVVIGGLLELQSLTISTVVEIHPSPSSSAIHPLARLMELFRLLQVGGQKERNKPDAVMVIKNSTNKSQ